jgi:competence protein ComEC
LNIAKFNPSLLLLILLFLVLLLRVDWNMFLYRPGIITTDESLLFGDLKLGIEANFAQILPSPQSGLLSGIVLGSKQVLPDDFRQALINTSTIHIVVASGQNLTILSGLIIGLASFIGRKKAVLASIGTNLFYSLLTGFQIPIMRAAFMNIFALSGQLFGREISAFYTLLASAVMMLVYEPLWLFSASFQLSFLATFAVMEYAPAIEPKFNRVPDILKQDLIVSACAFLFTLPVIFESFHRISVTGIIVNALVLWTTAIIMASGGIVAMVSLVSLDVAAALALVPGVFLTYLVYVVEFFNSLRPSVEVQPLGWVFWLGYYFLLMAVYVWAKRSVGMKEEEMV